MAVVVADYHQHPNNDAIKGHNDIILSKGGQKTMMMPPPQVKGIVTLEDGK